MLDVRQSLVSTLVCLVLALSCRESVVVSCDCILTVFVSHSWTLIPFSNTGHFTCWWNYRHCQHSMRSRVYETIELPSGCLVSHRSTTAAACGGFAAKRSEGQEISIDCCTARVCRRRRRWRCCTALSSQCGQCHYDSWRKKLNRDLLTNYSDEVRLFLVTTKECILISYWATCLIVVWPTMSCFADWSKRRHVIII